MVRVLALIAIVLLAGFTGGTGAAFSKQTPHLAYETVAHIDNASEAASSDQGQIISSADHHDAGPSDCCSDSTCFNPSHCHHCGPTALLTWLNAGVGVNSPKVFGPCADDMPVQNVATSISKPPRV